MDGVTKQLAEYFEKLERLGSMAMEAIKEQLDIEADRAEGEIRSGTPKGKTGGLQESLKKTIIDTPKKYGYSLEYKGENTDGVPYGKIAVRPDRALLEVKTW